MAPPIRQGPAFFWPDPDTVLLVFHVQIWPDPACLARGSFRSTHYLLFVEHFADQAAYDAHTSSPAYRDLIAGQFAGMIAEFTELDHELVVGL
jgi:quinol monooxygenase YgiN